MLQAPNGTSIIVFDLGYDLFEVYEKTFKRFGLDVCFPDNTNNINSSIGLSNWQRKRFMTDISTILTLAGKKPLKNLDKKVNPTKELLFELKSLDLNAIAKKPLQLIRGLNSELLKNEKDVSINDIPLCEFNEIYNDLNEIKKEKMKKLISDQSKSNNKNKNKIKQIKDDVVLLENIKHKIHTVMNDLDEKYVVKNSTIEDFPKLKINGLSYDKLENERVVGVLKNNSYKEALLSNSKVVINPKLKSGVNLLDVSCHIINSVNQMKLVTAEKNILNSKEMIISEKLKESQIILEKERNKKTKVRNEALHREKLRNSNLKYQEKILKLSCGECDKKSISLLQNNRFDIFEMSYVINSFDSIVNDKMKKIENKKTILEQNLLKGDKEKYLKIKRLNSKPEEINTVQEEKGEEEDINENKLIIENDSRSKMLKRYLKRKKKNISKNLVKKINSQKNNRKEKLNKKLKKLEISEERREKIKIMMKTHNLIDKIKMVQNSKGRQLKMITKLKSLNDLYDIIMKNIKVLKLISERANYKLEQPLQISDDRLNFDLIEWYETLKIDSKLCFHEVAN